MLARRLSRITEALRLDLDLYLPKKPGQETQVLTII